MLETYKMQKKKNEKTFMEIILLYCIDFQNLFDRKLGKFSTVPLSVDERFVFPLSAK